jgi:hypothetical protein
MNRFHTTAVCLFSIVLFFALGCASPEGENQENLTEESNQETSQLSEIETCEPCLEAGGTWQPEAQECTENCDIMDISCYETTCPGACEDECRYCFGGEQECLDQGCNWNQDAEAMWCN